MSETTGFRCHFCDTCDGRGCIGELPGMGGVYENGNFIGNCKAWADYAPASGSRHAGSAAEGRLPIPVRLAPITGAIQNVGYPDEKAFYEDIIASSLKAGIRLSIGDGYPDEKLKFGIAALASFGAKGAVFIKPYENRKILERMEWAAGVAEMVGVDIDSWAIVTMRNLVNLEKKDAARLLELKRAAKVPFMIKGIFRDEDIELVREVRPDIAVVSNHGGRLETLRGSTAAFLSAHGAELRRYAGAVWVDGGIRTGRDIGAAAALGADEVMMGRPLITALCKGGNEGVRDRVLALTGSI